MFKNKLGEDSPIQNFIRLKIQRRDGIESLSLWQLLRVSSRYPLMAALTLIYPVHFEDIPCQSGVNHIYEG